MRPWLCARELIVYTGRAYRSGVSFESIQFCVLDVLMRPERSKAYLLYDEILLCRCKPDGGISGENGFVGKVI